MSIYLRAGLKERIKAICKLTRLKQSTYVSGLIESDLDREGIKADIKGKGKRNG